MRSAALGVLAAASAAIVAVSWSASPAAQWAFVLASVAFPPALIWLGVGHRRHRRSLVLAVAALLVLLEAAAIGVLAWRGADDVGHWLIGLPPGGVFFILGLWLLPFVLTTWAHAATFDPTGLRPEDLAALRRRRQGSAD